MPSSTHPGCNSHTTCTRSGIGIYTYVHVHCASIYSTCTCFFLSCITHGQSTVYTKVKLMDIYIIEVHVHAHCTCTCTCTCRRGCTGCTDSIFLKHKGYAHSIFLSRRGCIDYIFLSRRGCCSFFFFPFSFLFK